MQIEIKDDQVFFGWPLHMKLSGAAPLYRGMVVMLGDGTGTDGTDDGGTGGDGSRHGVGSTSGHTVDTALESAVQAAVKAAATHGTAA